MIINIIRKLLTLKLQKMLIMSPKKVRKIGMSDLSLTGNFYSVKENKIVNFESSLERDYIHLLEFDNNVYRYFEQPIKIYYGNQRYYVPDFFVKFHSSGFKDELVEVKYSNDLEENAEKYYEKFEAARNFCNDNNITFKIITEKEIRGGFKLHNAKFLLGYVNPKAGFNEFYIDLLRNILETKSGVIKIEEALTLATKNESKRGEILYVLLHMLSKRYIHFNENEKLTLNTLIYSEC